MCCLQPECDPFGLKSIKDKSELQFLPDANPRMTKMEYALLETFRGLLDSEQSILGLMAEGKSNGEIAKILFVSDSSIRNASSRIYNKIGARNRQDAVVLHTRHQQLTSIFGD
jgi:DNA-binding NarL/FixJ family response regulator